VKRIHWLDQVQYEARHRGIGPNRKPWSALSSGLLVPPNAAANFPICEECGGQLLDAIELVEETRMSVTILGKHHGEEDYFRIDFERPWTQDDLTRALRSAVLFRREHFENV
jgi:hypothetical protein